MERMIYKTEIAEMKLRFAGAALFSSPNKAISALCFRHCFQLSIFHLQVQSYVTRMSFSKSLKFVIFSLCDQIRIRAFFVSKSIVVSVARVVIIVVVVVVIVVVVVVVSASEELQLRNL